MLPCNVIVQQLGDGLKVTEEDPVASMHAVENKSLKEIAIEIRDKLRSVIDSF